MIENFCEIIKKICKDPLAQVTGLTARDYINLQEHVKDCAECIRLTDEILDKYKDVPPSNPNLNDGRYN